MPSYAAQIFDVSYPGAVGRAVVLILQLNTELNTKKKQAAVNALKRRTCAKLHLALVYRSAATEVQRHCSSRMLMQVQQKHWPI